ncbi:MAG: YetF domain-containing protein [Tistlia sp.]|uniref:DUF421 domain-containing protein n=1 Tax=Tistlia sp. TaxID=3057121 RepID=UPI0034A3449E
MEEFLHPIIGADADTILWWQMVVRGLLIFAYGLALVRLAPIRSFARTGAFDIVLVVILGSILSRALTANAQFLPTLATATALVLFHALLAWLSVHSRRFGFLVKGEPIRLVRDGRVDERAMRRAVMNKGDLELALRSNGVADAREVEAVYLERNGKITVLARNTGGD